MTLEEFLENNRDRIVDKWVEYTLKTYQSPDFLQTEQDPFANPIGSTIRHTLNQLYSLLGTTTELTVLQEPLADLMHLRSVQQFAPSQAIAPINSIKHIVREAMAEDSQTSVPSEQLYDFDFGVDLAVLAAFDLYSACREKLYKLRVAEIKSGSSIITDSACPSKVLHNIGENEASK